MLNNHSLRQWCKLHLNTYKDEEQRNKDREGLLEGLGNALGIIILILLGVFLCQL